MTFCPICFRHMKTTHKNGRPRHYCAVKCYDEAQRNIQKMVDLTAVYRLTLGDLPEVTTVAERIQAAANLTKLGYSLMQISKILQVTDRTVSRYRKLSNRSSHDLRRL